MTAFSIVDQQPEFIVVNKAENINFHDEEQLGQGLFNQVKSSLALEELYPVHRLDKMTSGLVILAKTKQAAQAFQQLFEQHHIEKYYLALSYHKPKKKQGLIKGDMEKSRRGMYKLCRTMENPAITQFFSFSVPNENIKGLRLFLVKPHSGKTHQIRVALASIGAPILGDPLYSPKNNYASANEQGIDRGYLHAFSLKFELFNQQYTYTEKPLTGEYYQLLGSSKVFEEVAKPWQLAWPQVKK